MLRALLEKKINSKSFKSTALEIVKNSDHLNSNVKLPDNFNYNEVNKILKQLVDDNTILLTFYSLSAFLAQVHPEREIRKASYKIDELISSYFNKLNKNKNIYKVIKKIISSKEFNKLTSEEQFYLSSLKLGYERSGVNIEDVMELRSIKSQLRRTVSSLTNRIQKEMLIGVDPSQIQELVPETKSLFFVVQENPKRIGTYLSQYTFDSLITNISNPNLRSKIEYIYFRKGKETINEFRDLLNFRQEYAKALGYETFVDYKCKNCMISEPVKINKILKTLDEKLERKYQIELRNLMKIKKKIYAKKNIKNDGKLYSYDIPFLVKKWKEEYGSDEDKLRKYFIIGRTLPKILAVMGDIFNINFSLIQTKAYAKKVNIFKVTSDNNIIGYLYFDLTQRKGKKNFSNCYPIQPSVSFPYKLKDQESIVAVVENYPQLSNYGLSSNELFQLINHISQALQILFTKFNLPLESVRGERDVDKIFCFVIKLLFSNVNVIKKISSHVETRAQLEDEDIIKMIRARKVANAYFYKKSIFISLFDNFIHKTSRLREKLNKIDNNEQLFNNFALFYRKLYDNIFNKTTKIYLDDKIFPASNWTNLVDGRECLFHSYLFSEIIASDIVNTMIKKKYTYSRIGKELREKFLTEFIIRNGVKKMLGREFNLQGYIEINEIDDFDENSIYDPQREISSIKSNDISKSEYNLMTEDNVSVLSPINKYDEMTNYYTEKGLHSYTDNSN